LSVAKSGIWYSASANNTALTSDDTAANFAGTSYNKVAGTSSFGVHQWAMVRVKDAYGVGISSSTGLLTASATNGALIGLSNADVASPTQSTAYWTGVGSAFDNATLTVAAPASAPLTTVVTVSYNGTVIGSKTFTFTGNVAKVTLSAPSNGGITGTTKTTGTATIAFADAAGNVIYPISSDLYTPRTSLSTDASTLNAYVTGGSVVTWPTSSVSSDWQWNCSTLAGSANVAVKYVNNDGSVVTSNSLKVTCSGAPYTYSAALDKSTYNPGDIAKLTVTFKDSKGNLATDNNAIATTAPSLSGGNLSLIGGSKVDTGNTTDSLTNGAITYKFVVGAPTVDPYGGQLVVDFPTVDSSAQGAVTVSYKIASGSTSLNDVLKGIVSLIASINKQIAALAKLVTKKK